MKGATEKLFTRPGFTRVKEGHATVWAGICKRLDVVGLSPGHDDRVRTNVINVVVAGIRYVFLPAGPLPHFWPQRVDFLVKELLTGVALKRQVIVSQKLVGAGLERGWRLRCHRFIPGDNVRRSRTRAARLAFGQTGVCRFGEAWTPEVLGHGICSCAICTPSINTLVALIQAR